jgi:hypothetical protein
MMPRQVAAALLAAGLAAGTLVDRLGERIVPRAGEHWILAGDFHVHAAPGDGTLLPWELQREARRAGLDVIAVTNHNTTFAARFAQWWARSLTGGFPLVIAGQEITNPDYHMAAVGIRQWVDWRQPPAAAIADVHAQGGVAIAAHPGLKYAAGFDDRALALLDGAEAANSVDPLALEEYAAFRRRALALNADLAAIGSSDFHATPSLARARTYLLVRDQTEAGVLEAIRAGRTVAADDQGRLYGSAELVRVVGAHLPAGRSDDNAVWRRLSAVSAWCGAFGLLLFGRRSR